MTKYSQVPGEPKADMTEYSRVRGASKAEMTEYSSRVPGVPKKLR